MRKDKPIIIKRYQNRKLYDTQNSSYVTLDQIAKLIKLGQDIQIVDNRTKEDLTSVTLAQIIFEEEKKKSFIPLTALKRMVQEGGDQIKDFFERTIDSGVSSISKAKENAEKMIDRIKGELTSEDDGLLEKIKSTVESVTQVTHLQNEIRGLRKKIAHLEKELMEK